MVNASPNKNPSWIGQKFNSLTVVGLSFGVKNNTIWECLCDCGRTTRGQPSVIRRGGHSQCRVCARRRYAYTKYPIVKAGDSFGHLTVINRQENGRWLCECKCGGSVEIETKRLHTTKVPGCYSCVQERKKLGVVTHGDWGLRPGKSSKLYCIWYSMKTRCLKPSSKSYRYYGAKGIVVCGQWMDFAAFRDWSLANGYSDGLSIDRMDASGNYEPNNCEWITRSENSRRIKQPKLIPSLKRKIIQQDINDYIIGNLAMAA